MTDHHLTAMPYTDEAIRRVVREWAKLDREHDPTHITPRTVVRSHAPDLARTLDQLLAEYRAGR